ncbi:Armadillo repeat-containing protein 6 [Phytophthora boehmeriae]|uniref:Armadillo repeat-containing protein 6 n=1 Tax=Phytophthora boehmeriae TaxID=109152 RepID=A0A8T1X2W6_9STRA|nr:Armadillo repeat-containing protein 6 [Phytophthora boehmeriae]
MTTKAVRKQISQETFDECVAENVEDFDMSPEEAVADAVRQFKSQGVDLSNIIKSGSAQTSDGQEPLPERLKRLIAELKGVSKPQEQQDQVLSIVAELQKVCEEVSEARVVAGRNDAVDTLVALLEVESAAVVTSCKNSHALVELGAVRAISRAMQAHRRDVAVLRQASLAVRNMVARSVDLRPRFLKDEPDIEPVLREAQQYRGCGDEAYAALRDLGCNIQLSSFGAAAASAAAAGSIKATTIKPQFNPVQAESNELLETVEEAAKAPFAK